MTIAALHARPTFSVPAFIWRLARGASHNFSIRVSDWFASLVMMTFGLLLVYWTGAFDENRYFAVLEQFAPAYTWGLICTLIGVGRIVALAVNGTFPSFRWSPHLRFLMAMLSAFVWFQIMLGLIAANAPTTALAVYPHLFLFDLYNVFLAASEAGIAERRYRNVGGSGAPDILSNLPNWVQLPANLGMFAVAVAAAAFGFTKRLGSSSSSTIPEVHFLEGGQFQRTGDDIRDAAAASIRTAEALEGMLAVLEASAREEAIEREVRRRMREQGAGQGQAARP